MYNRYIPQQDGTYRKNRIETPQPPPAEQAQNSPHFQSKPPHPPAESAYSFLHQLLPKGLDTGDLLIIILLLLMAGDGKENKNSWLLTLALYLFL